MDKWCYLAFSIYQCRCLVNVGECCNVSSTPDSFQWHRSKVALKPATGRKVYSLVKHSREIFFCRCHLLPLAEVSKSITAQAVNNEWKSWNANYSIEKEYCLSSDILPSPSLSIWVLIGPNFWKFLIMFNFGQHCPNRSLMAKGFPLAFPAW